MPVKGLITMQWEYLTITQERRYKTGDWDPALDLNLLGSEEWELVTVAPITKADGMASGATYQLRYVFKRPKLTPPPALQWLDDSDSSTSENPHSES